MDFLKRRKIMKKNPNKLNLKQILIILLAAGLTAVLLIPFLRVGITANASSTSWIPPDEPWQAGTPLLQPVGDQANAHCPDDPDTFYIIGGRRGDSIEPGVGHSFMQFNTNTGSWITLPDIPEGLISSTSVCYEGNIYVIGGEYENAHKEFYIYNIATKTWTVGPPAPRFVVGAALGVRDGKLYLVGGTHEYAKQGYHPTSQVDIYEINTGTWHPAVLKHIPVPVSFPGFAQDGRYLYLVGGFTGNYNHNSFWVQRLDMSNLSWQIGPIFNTARANVAAELTDGHLYAIGGDRNGGDQHNMTTLVEVLDLADWPHGAWHSFGAPLPIPIIGNSTACTDAFMEGMIWSTGGETLSTGMEPTLLGTNYFHVVEPCINYYFGNLTKEDFIKDGARGSTVRYTIPLINDGTGVDYYDISIDSQWPSLTPSSTIGPIEPGKSDNVIVDIYVPTTPVPVDHNTAVVTITSHGDPSESDSAVLKTYFTTPTGTIMFDLLPMTTVNQAGHPGNVLTYKLMVTNTGDLADTYNLEINATWKAYTPYSAITLQPGESVELAIIVTIPENARPGESDNIILTLTSNTDVNIGHSVNLTSTSDWYRLLLPVALRN
jgi:hypothetical protein